MKRFVPVANFSQECKVRSSQHLNNSVAQDHRRGKQRIRPLALIAYVNQAPFLPPDEEEKFLELVRRLQPDYPYRLNTIGRS
jgi:hypothetical protein